MATPKKKTTADRNKTKTTREQNARISKISKNPNVSPYVDSLAAIANGDRDILNSLIGGAGLGNQLFAPGSLGRVDENVSGNPDVASILSMARGMVSDGTGLDRGINAAQQAFDSSNINSGINQEVLNALRGTLGNSKDQTQALGIANENALNARQLTPLEMEMLDVRRSGMSGMNTRELTAAREGGIQNADGSFSPGEAAINRAAQSALLSLGGQNLANRRGISSGSLGVIGGAQQAQGDLERKLILDEFNSKLTGQNNFVNTAGNIQTGLDSRINNTSSTYGNMANNAQQVAGVNANNFGNAVQGMNTGMANAAQGLNTAILGKENTLAGRLDRYMNAVGNVRNEELYRQTFNLNQIDREKAGMSASIFGAGAFGAQNKGTKDANAIAKDQLEAARQFSGGGNPWSSGQKSSGNSTGQASTNQNTDAFETA